MTRLKFNSVRGGKTLDETHIFSELTKPWVLLVRNLLIALHVFVSVGPYCEYLQPAGIDPDSYDTFQEYRMELELSCRKDVGDVLEWTPDRNTPDTVYYQVQCGI